MSLIHASRSKPRIFPGKGDVAPAEIDRAQSIDPSTSLNREKVEEIGREAVVGYIKKNPSTTYGLTQLEYGNMEFFKKLTNQATTVKTITLSSFKTAYFDLAAYLTDDDDTFKATVWYPELRVAGFSLEIGEPQAIVERSFDLVGENAVIWQGDNKYIHFQREEIESGDTGEITLTATATLDPNDSVYMIKIRRVRGTTTTDLVKDTDFTEDDADTVSITTPVVGDVYKLYYTSSTAPADADMWTANDSDAVAILADSVSIYLYIPASGKPSSSDCIYRLQTASLNVSFERGDIRELGNKNIVARGITDKTVSVSLGRILEAATIEEVLAGQVADYGKLDVEQFTDEAVLLIKVYSDNTKTTFQYGFKATGLSPTDLSGGTGVNAYVGRDVTIEGEDLTISETEATIGTI